MIDSPRLIQSTPNASWLPEGGTAEVWAGAELEVPEPAVIVRLLLLREGGQELFCVRTEKGFDLPTLFLGGDGGWRSVAYGIGELTTRYLGHIAPVKCVGFVRNVVREADAAYRLPVPFAHVPVFTPTEPYAGWADLKGEGVWIGVADAPVLLSQRHWWPIARVRLASRPG
ncbi:MAG: NUDIX hydrolase [Hamadaea sp.]|uniref:hypothetical protein n=1 Tax=Hamadaea sp. TaxID=2024425 RepID=UPI0017F215A0|nr:hypothetical protein [Hamadaea sp.]NUR71770.1 NUDIX hydrolase [Hamadaea sp.]NUT19084.1 NUDIX hydrolase [Hamadaea sp.]